MKNLIFWTLVFAASPTFHSQASVGSATGCYKLSVNIRANSTPRAAVCFPPGRPSARQKKICRTQAITERCEPGDSNRHPQPESQSCRRVRSWRVLGGRGRRYGLHHVWKIGGGRHGFQ